MQLTYVKLRHLLTNLESVDVSMVITVECSHCSVPLKSLRNSWILGLFCQWSPCIFVACVFLCWVEWCSLIISLTLPEQSRALRKLLYCSCLKFFQSMFLSAKFDSNATSMVTASVMLRKRSCIWSTNSFRVGRNSPEQHSLWLLVATWQVGWSRNACGVVILLLMKAILQRNC